MRITVEQVAGGEALGALARVREEVFGREMGIKLGPPELAGCGVVVTHLLARAGPGREPVGALSVVDTSGDRRLHESCGLAFGARARVARFTCLAVLRPYRGMNVPLMMALEAHRRVIAPRRFDYIWLLFNAERAAGSFLSRLLGFTPRAETFVSEYGCRRPLVRDERAPGAALTILRAEQFLERVQSLSAPTESRPAFSLGGT